MTASYTLDALDERIVEQLQDDAALTNAELAKRVHASAPTCMRRVKRLRETGVIERQIAILASDAFGPSLTAVVEITLDAQGDELQRAFEAQAIEEAAVLQCYRVSPGPDFILVVQVRDMQAYHNLAHRLFASHANVRNVRSFFSIHRAKFETRLPR